MSGLDILFCRNGQEHNCFYNYFGRPVSISDHLYDYGNGEEDDDDDDDGGDDWWLSGVPAAIQPIRGKGQTIQEQIVEEVHIHSRLQQEALEYALRKIRESAVAGYIVAVYLYGSCARGEERLDSDIDLFIEFSDAFPVGDREMCGKVSDLRQDVMMPSGGDRHVWVDLAVEFGSGWCKSRSTYYRNVRKDGKLLWEPEHPILPEPGAEIPERRLRTFRAKAEEAFSGLMAAYDAGYRAAPMATDAHFACEWFMKHIIDSYYFPEDEEGDEEETWVLRTHNLCNLINFLDEKPGISYTRECERGMREVNGYYFVQHETAPPDLGVMTPKEIERCFEVARMCREETLRICGELDAKKVGTGGESDEQ